jgi:hypothetical protein
VVPLSTALAHASVSTNADVDVCRAQDPYTGIDARARPPPRSQAASAELRAEVFKEKFGEAVALAAAKRAEALAEAADGFRALLRERRSRPGAR